MIKSTTAQGEVRIIGGKWRGRKLKFPAVHGLRPSADRIRETLFNWLMPYLEGANVLDLYAGSGALGFEAVSRGALSAIFIDKSKEVVQYLQQQIEIFKSDNCIAYTSQIPFDLNLFTRPWPQFFSKNNLTPPLFDLIFLDPPFHQGLIKTTCEWLESQNYMSDEALIYLEAEESLNPLPIPTHWEIIRSKTSGQVGYHLVKRKIPIA